MKNKSLVITPLCAAALFLSATMSFSQTAEAQASKRNLVLCLLPREKQGQKTRRVIGVKVPDSFLKSNSIKNFKCPQKGSVKIDRNNVDILGLSDAELNAFNTIVNNQLNFGSSTPGAKGDKGDKGDRGATGPQGPAGATGAQGPQGAKGDRGDAGPAGAVGPAGPQGAAGPQGPQGAKGDKGDRGDTGPAGASGPQGPIGATGPQGPQGPTGPQGPAGAGINFASCQRVHHAQPYAPAIVGIAGQTATTEMCPNINQQQTVLYSYSYARVSVNGDVVPTFTDVTPITASAGTTNAYPIGITIQGQPISVTPSFPGATVTWRIEVNAYCCLRN